MKRTVYLALYIVDNLMVGYVETINATIAVVKDIGLILKIIKGLQDYLFFKVRFSSEKRGLGYYSLLGKCFLQC